MYISYDLVKALQNDRLSRAMSKFEASRHLAIPEVSPGTRGSEEAEVIELVFSAHCETDRIGA